MNDHFNWRMQAATYGDVVIERLRHFGLEVRDKVRVKRLITPYDLERLTGARQGALYGASSNDILAAFRRPHNRASDIQGLYFAGGTTHPGGGVPMVMLSGRVAAQLLLADRTT